MHLMPCFPLVKTDAVSVAFAIIDNCWKDNVKAYYISFRFYYKPSSFTGPSLFVCLAAV